MVNKDCLISCLATIRDRLKVEDSISNSTISLPSYSKQEVNEILLYLIEHGYARGYEGSDFVTGEKLIIVTEIVE